MKVAAVGDLSFNGDEKPETKKTIRNIANQKPDLVLALGDLSYVKEAGPFLEAMVSFDANKIKPVMGNHDDDEKLRPQAAETYWTQIKRKFNLVKQYYSFYEDKICFIVLYTNRDYIADRDQKKFAENILSEASTKRDQGKIDWIIVCYHKPTVTSKTSGGHAPELGFARIYHSLFDKYGVDLILTGHNHNYQRSKLLTNNRNVNRVTEPIAVEQKHLQNTEYDTRKGRIFMVIGTGGREVEGFEGDQEDYIEFRLPKINGILTIELESPKRMNCKFITNAGAIKDEFTLDKST